MIFSKDLVSELINVFSHKRQITKRKYISDF